MGLVEPGERDAQCFWLTVIDALAAAGGALDRLAATPAFDGQAVVARLRAHLRSLASPSC